MLGQGHPTPTSGTGQQPRVPPGEAGRGPWPRPAHPGRGPPLLHARHSSSTWPCTPTATPQRRRAGSSFGTSNGGSERSSACPQAPAQRAGAGGMPRSGSAPAHGPRPTARSRGGGGCRQAAFHPVNYSVANSAPRRGGRRESESEPSHGGGGNTAHGGGQKRGASPGLGPCRSLAGSPDHVSWNPAGRPMGGPWAPPRAGERQPVPARLAAWAGGSRRPARKLRRVTDTPSAPGLPWSCRTDKWHGTSPSRAQPGLCRQSPQGQTWQGRHVKFLGSTEVLPQHRSPPRLGF